MRTSIRRDFGTRNWSAFHCSTQPLGDDGERAAYAAHVSRREALEDVLALLRARAVRQFAAPDLYDDPARDGRLAQRLRRLEAYEAGT